MKIVYAAYSHPDCARTSTEVSFGFMMLSVVRCLTPFVAVLVIVGCATTASYPSISDLAHSDPMSPEEFEELRSAVEALGAVFNVERRGEHTLYFRYAEELVRRGEYTAALRAYTEGLRVDAFDLESQVRAAEIEIELRQFNSAYERLTFVAARSEEGSDLRRYADHLISRYDLEDVFSLTTIPDRPDLVLSIRPIGDVPSPILSAIRSRIEQEFRVTVTILPAVDVPDIVTTRYTLTHTANRVIADIEQNNPPELIRGFYQNLGIKIVTSLTEAEKHLVLRALVEREDDGAAHWRQMTSDAYYQYDADDLLSYISGVPVARSETSAGLGVLAVTGIDLFREDVNFLFSLSRPGASVMSLNRFYNPKKDRLDTGIHRAVVQAMSSFVQIIGVPRASTLPCATAYPHSLEEFDQKTDRLCEETRARIVDAYREF